MTPVALVTGAAQRLGRAIAEDLARQGFRIAVHYNSSAAAAEALAAGLNAGQDEGPNAGPSGAPRAVALQADLTDETQVATLLPRAAAVLGPVTVLVNNASLFENDTIATMSRASWEAHLAVNLRSPLVLAQDFAAALPEGVEGNIVNILDQRVWRLTPRFFSYTVAKAGLWAATQTLAQALAPRIRVNAIGPGPTLRNARQSEADFARQCAATVLGRGAHPEDIAAALRYLLAAKAVTGQMIAVDGGQHLAWQTPDVTGISE